jgi:7,8-dihydropterin-6-yl-methyl-4-(beta-D-ribofuranosyl)aminobenzene 5'-phosphate synthase
MSELVLTIIYDDINGIVKGFKKDFGFSVLIEQNSSKILFDTGTNPSVLFANLKQNNIAPNDLNAIILSHNHYDHTDGISAITNTNPSVPIFVHKYWNREVVHQGKDISKLNLIEVTKPGEQKGLPRNIFVTAPLPSPDYGNIDEHAIFIKTDKSFILLCGCCHPGLISFLGQREILGIDQNEHLNIIGGLHGFKFLDSIAKELFPQIDRVLCCHCTQNVNDFKRQFKDKCSLAKLGEKYIFTFKQNE